MKKLVYVANLRLPTEKAYGIQIAKTCEAFALLKFKVKSEKHAPYGSEASRSGSKVTDQNSKLLEENLEVKLIAPHRISKIKDDFFDYYGIKRNFIFKKIFALDFYLPGFLNKIAFGTKSLCSALVLVLYALIEGADIFYTRDELVAYVLSFFGKNIIFEGHRFSNKRKIFYSRFKNINLKIVVISQGLKDDFINFGIKESNILIARDGVDLDLFNIEMTKEEARNKHHFPLDKKIVMYSGHLFEWKGAALLLEVARNFQFSIFNFQKNREDILFVFVGGTDYDVKKFRQKAEGLNNVLILGHRPYDQIPSLLRVADVLVLPNSSREEISNRYTSPLKLFEYMASSRPIVASSLPSITEILNYKNAFLVKPDDVHGLMEGIRKLLDDSLSGVELAQRALEDVQSYTWQERSRKILNFIS